MNGVEPVVRFAMAVERGKVAEFARATFASDPGAFGEFAPPTFPATSRLWGDTLADDLVAVDGDRVHLHGEEEVAFPDGPPRIGDRLEGTSRVEGRWSRPGRLGGDMGFTVLRTELRAPGGRLAVVVRRTIVSLPRDRVGKLAGSAGPAVAGREGGARVGDRVVGPLGRADIVRYQGASGDFTPIHFDDGLARQAGYPSVFSVGMLHAGMLGNLVAEAFGIAGLRFLRCRFRAVVWPGDTLVLRVHGDRAGAHGGEEASVGIEATRQDGETVVDGEARFLAGEATPKRSS